MISKIFPLSSFHILKEERGKMVCVRQGVFLFLRFLRFAVTHNAFICREPFMCHIHQLLKLLFSGRRSLMHLILDYFNLLIEWRNPLLQFYNETAYILDTLIL